MGSSASLNGFGAAGWIVFIAAAAVSFGLLWLLLPMLRRHALAHPNARSSHKTPTPQGGGIAVIAATVGVVTVTVLVGGSDVGQSFWLILAATVFIAVVGVIDDAHSIAVAPRLILQVIAVAIVLAALPGDLRVVPMLPAWVERALLGLALLWFVNLTNFMDGIDWMTVAEAVPLSAGLVLFGLMGALPREATLVALTLCGAVVGFAPFNRPVAKLFLGDVGSLPIGLLLGWLLIVLAGAGHFAAALLLPLYYLADATITLLRRLMKGEPVWQAHRSHFYQRATDRGYSVSQIVARVFVLNVALIALAAATLVTASSLLHAAALGRRLRSGRLAALPFFRRQGLIDSADHPLRRQFIEACAVTVEPPLAAFQLAWHARQRILHQPDIAAALKCARGRPDVVYAAGRPWPPKPRISRPVERNRRTARGGGEMRHRGVGANVDARLRQQAGELRP